MRQITKRIIKRTLWSITIFSLTIGVLLFFAMQFAWRVTGSLTSVMYSVSPTQSSLTSIQDAVEKIAKKHNLERQSGRELTTHFAIWRRQGSIFHTNDFDMNLRIDAYPRDEIDARKTRVYISVITRDADKTIEWQTVAKELEMALPPLGKITKASVTLDADVFGLCTSESRPHVADTICSYSFEEVPINFDDLNKRVPSKRPNQQ